MSDLRVEVEPGSINAPMCVVEPPEVLINTDGVVTRLVAKYVEPIDGEDVFCGAVVISPDQTTILGKNYPTSRVAGKVGPGLRSVYDMSVAGYGLIGNTIEVAPLSPAARQRELERHLEYAKAAVLGHLGLLESVHTPQPSSVRERRWWRGRS